MPEEDRGRQEGKAWAVIGLVALAAALWQLAPPFWTDTIACGRSKVKGDAALDVNDQLDRVLGPRGTLVTEGLLHGTLKMLVPKDSYQLGPASGLRIQADGVEREFMRTNVDSVWVRVR